MKSDGELVGETLRGLTSSYGELARRWAPRVLAVCHSRLRRPGVAEDMAQEALTRGYAALGTLSEPEKFGAWLCGIATRVCLDWLKAKARTQVTFSQLTGYGQAEDIFASPPDSAEGRLEEAEEVRTLLDAVDRLPEEYRKVIMLFYYDEISYQEIGNLLGVSAATVNARLTKARALLRARLSRARRDP